MASVCVLGTGMMGAGIARNLAKAGHQVTVWNRNTEKARPHAPPRVAQAHKAPAPQPRAATA